MLNALFGKLNSTIKKVYVNKAHGCDDIFYLYDENMWSMNCQVFVYNLPELSLSVHNKGDKEVFNNYRTVSLLPVHGKILERLVFNSIF